MSRKQDSQRERIDVHPDRHGGFRQAGAIGEFCPKAGISEATFYNWRKRCAGLMPSEVKRPRQLEEENAKLKRLSMPRQSMTYQFNLFSAPQQGMAAWMPRWPELPEENRNYQELDHSAPLKMMRRRAELAQLLCPGWLPKSRVITPGS